MVVARNRGLGVVQNCQVNKISTLNPSRVVESHVEKKILGLLDVIALEVTHLRGDVTELRGDATHLCGAVTELRGDVTQIRGDLTELRGDVTELRGEVGTMREDLAAFRVETSQNFNRLTRRLDSHETRIVALEQREV